MKLPANNLSSQQSKEYIYIYISNIYKTNRYQSFWIVVIMTLAKISTNHNQGMGPKCVSVLSLCINVGFMGKLH